MPFQFPRILELTYTRQDNDVVRAFQSALALLNEQMKA